MYLYLMYKSILILWDPGFNGDPFFVDTVRRADFLYLDQGR